MIALIIGYGSIGRRHYKVIKKSKKFSKIYILTKQTVNGLNIIRSLSSVKKINPDFILIANETSKHYKYLKYLESNLKNKKILVEKPLFEKFRNLKIIHNKVFIGYNLRFDPIIEFLKNKIRNQKIILLDLICHSYLPLWRNNIHYSKSSSAKKSSAGGILNDLSHEFDLISYLTSDYTIKYGSMKKMSKLRIQTSDFLVMNAYNKLCKFISLQMSTFSHNHKRQISIITNDETIEADLTKRTLKISNKQKKSTIKFSKINRDYTYIHQLKSILNKKHRRLCSYFFGLKNMKKIDHFRKICQLSV